MNEFISSIEAADTIAVTGHIHPDGDCIGSCLGLRQYILDNYPGKSVTVYLESIAPEFLFLSGADSVKQEAEHKSYDLFFVLDCSSLDRSNRICPCMNARQRRSVSTTTSAAKESVRSIF